MLFASENLHENNSDNDNEPDDRKPAATKQAPRKTKTKAVPMRSPGFKSPPRASMPNVTDEESDMDTMELRNDLDFLCFGPWNMEFDEQRVSIMIRPLAGCNPCIKGEFNVRVLDRLDVLRVIQKSNNWMGNQLACPQLDNAQLQTPASPRDQ